MISPTINKITGIIFLLFFLVQTQAQSFYSLATKDITGREFGLEKYKGKKLLIVIVSPDNNDSLMRAISKFKAKYGDKIEVIGLTVQDSSTDSTNARKIVAFNNFKSSRIALVEGGSRNTPSAAPLLRWLSNRNNTHAFFKDITVAGCKFFIGEQGTILNVLSPQTPLDAPIIDFIVNTRPQRKLH